MELNHIQENECSVCGARAKAETQENKHCNGEWNESRSFGCGKKLSYSPNFRMTTAVRQCPNDPKEAIILSKRKEAKEKLVNYIKKLDADDTYIGRFLRDIEYT